MQMVPLARRLLLHAALLRGVAFGLEDEEFFKLQVRGAKASCAGLWGLCAAADVAAGCCRCGCVCGDARLLCARV